MRDWPLMIALMTVSSKWLLEGILGKPLLEMLGLVAAFGLMFLIHGSIRIKQAGAVWMIYMFSITVSVLMNGRTFSILGRAIMFFIVIWFAIAMDSEDFDSARILHFIVRIGIFHGALVLMHFVLRERFNKLYFPHLTAVSRDYAQAYFNGGRYFGIITSPHDVAGLVSFAVFGVFFWLILQKQKSKPLMLLTAVLFISLLLTGKKGVMLCMVVGIFLTMMTMYADAKQWSKIGKILLLLAVCIAVFRYLMLKYPDHPVFYRLTTYLERIQKGDSADSGRSELYKIAVKLWDEHKVFGVGWRRFKDLSVTRFHQRMAHEVNLDYLQWLCEMGLLGFILNIIPVLVMLYRTVFVCKRFTKTIQDPQVKWQIMFAVCIQFFTFFYAFFEVPFYDLIFFTVYIISCIIINSMYKRIRTGGLPIKYLLPFRLPSI